MSQEALQWFDRLAWEGSSPRIRRAASVLAWLAVSTNGDGMAAPGRRRLVRRTGTSLSHVDRGLRDLVTVEAIVRMAKPAPGAATVYAINIGLTRISLGDARTRTTQEARTPAERAPSKVKRVESGQRAPEKGVRAPPRVTRRIDGEDIHTATPLTPPRIEAARKEVAGKISAGFAVTNPEGLARHLAADPDWTPSQDAAAANRLQEDQNRRVAAIRAGNAESETV